MRKPLMRVLVGVFWAAGTGSTLAVVAEPWTTYQGNASHTGYVPVSLNPAQFAFRWQRNLGGSLNPVTAADGKVFVSKLVYFDPTDSLFALNAETGETLWSKNFGSIYSVNPPAYAGGNVYVQTGDHSSDTYLRAYNASTGEFVFRSPHSAQWERYYAPTIHNGKVFINGGYYGGMYSFNAVGGHQNWFANLPQYDNWTPAVDDWFAYAYVGNALHVVNRDTGTLAFRITDPNFSWLGWSMSLAPVLGSENDVLAIQGSRLISFDLMNQRIRWELDRDFEGQPTLANGVIYAIDAGVLTARDELTGDYLWGWEVPSARLTGTIIATDSHLFARTSTTVYAIDLLTHQATWSYAASGHLALSEGVLYLAGSDGKLTAITLPEPASLSILLLGAGLALFRRRRGH